MQNTEKSKKPEPAKKTEEASSYKTKANEALKSAFKVRDFKFITSDNESKLSQKMGNRKQSSGVSIGGLSKLGSSPDMPKGYQKRK